MFATYWTSYKFKYAFNVALKDYFQGMHDICIINASV